MAERALPAETAPRQPVHTVYEGAHLFTADVVQRVGAAARLALAEHAPDAAALADIFGYAPALADRIYPRILNKLTREPIEDYRIDFEDGFGRRSDAEEDSAAVSTASEVAAAMAAGTLPYGLGIRVKAFNDDLKPRSLRTIDLFLTRLLDRSHGALPRRFVITLSKVTAAEQVAALASACDAFEHARGLAPGTLRLELMIETTQSIFSPDGVVALPALLAAGRGRIAAAHFGTYDYTAACGITAAHQHMRHPACDFAKHVMQVSLAGTGVELSDGSTNILPVGDRPAIHRAWRRHAEDIRHSLEGAFYQGWDLHPAQLPSRYAALYAFFTEGIDAAADRLRHVVSQTAQATRAADVLDDAATGQALLNYVLRAVGCGAIAAEDAAALSGLTVDDLRGRSFLQIIALRSPR